MKSLRNSYNYILLGIVILLAITLVIPAITTIRVFAAESNGQGIQISPVRIELNADKGKSYKLKIKVTNVTAGELILTPEVNDFKAKDELGTPEIILEGNNPSQFSLKSWISLPSEFRLKSKESKDLSISVILPSDAEAGGHYGVVRFSGRPPELKDTGVSLAASIGTLILARVGGTIKEDLKIVEYYTASNKKKQGLFEGSPITFVERVKNDGTVHVKPSGTIEIKNMFGKNISSLKINDQATRNVLPGSISRFEQEFKKSWLIGRYTADLSMGYGTTGGLVQGTIVFWVIPWKIILFVLSLLILMSFVIRSWVRRYTKRILAKHGKR